MKKLILAGLSLMVAGCGLGAEPPRKTDAQVAEEARHRIDGDASFTSFTLEVRCVDGVQYYFYHVPHTSYFAPVVDRTTLQFKPCGIP